MSLREVIKARRKVLGLSQQDLAEMSGVSLPTVKDIERGLANPSLSTISKLPNFETFFFIILLYNQNPKKKKGIRSIRNRNRALAKYIITYYIKLLIWNFSAYCKSA